MVSSNLGYIFECRHDATDRLGLVNKYNLLINEGTVNLTITCGVDSKGKIAELFRINRSLGGFECLSDFCKTEQDVQTFVKSNKSMFNVLGEFFLIADGTLTFNQSDYSLISDKKFFFYAPVTEVKDGGNPAMLSKRLSIKEGLNLFCVRESVYQSYYANFLKNITPDFFKDRKSYIQSILSIGGE